MPLHPKGLINLKGDVAINTLHDYVKWIANSIGITLTEEKIDGITLKLAQSEKYKEMITELEGMILDRN